MTSCKIAIAGTDYVGLSNGILLARHNEVVALDIIPEKAKMINKKQLSLSLGPLALKELKEIVLKIEKENNFNGDILK